MKKYSLLLALIILTKIFLPINLNASAEKLDKAISKTNGIKTFAYLDDKSYRLKEYDEITFIYNNSAGELIQTSNIQVLPTGTITLPKFGEVLVKDLTIKEIKENLVKTSSTMEMKDLDIIVNRHQRAHVFVIGAVYNPGSFSVKDMHTIYDAIATAGGFNRISNKSKVKVVRQRKDGTRLSFYIDFPKEVFKAYDNGIGADRYLVQENDLIYVPESFLKKTRIFVGELLKFATAGLISGAVSASLD